MAEDIQQIRDFLDRLRRRERVLLLAIGLFWSLAALAGGGLLVSGVLSAGGSRSTGLTLSVLVVVGALVAGGWALSGWRSSGDIQRQARLVEGLVPALRSRLLTAVDWANKQQAAVSV